MALYENQATNKAENNLVIKVLVILIAIKTKYFLITPETQPFLDFMKENGFSQRREERKGKSRLFLALINFKLAYLCVLSASARGMLFYTDNSSLLYKKDNWLNLMGNQKIFHGFNIIFLA